MNRPGGRRARRTVAATVAILLGLVSATGCGDHDDTSPGGRPAAPRLASADAGDLHLDAGWVARTLPGDAAQMKAMDGPTTAGYAELENSGAHDDRLVSASSDLAATVQIHRTVSTDGSAHKMVRANGMDVPAHRTARLEPGGYHLMIMGLRHRLEAGARIAVDLVFASGTRMSVEFPVIDRADRPRSGGR